MFKCNVLFGLVCTENTRKRLKASKNDIVRVIYFCATSRLQPGTSVLFSFARLQPAAQNVNKR